jgi:hypothetical protein
LTGTTTIQAVAYESGYVDSPVASSTYTFASGGNNGALVQSNATASLLPGSSSLSVAFASGVTAGNTIFVFAQYYSAAVTASASDSCGDQFQQISGSPVSAAGGTAHWFISRNVAGGACSVTVTYGSPTPYGGVAVFEISGLGGASAALDQYASGSGNGTIASATLTPTQPNSFAIAQLWSGNGGAPALGGNWTTQERQHFSTLYQSNIAGWQVLNSSSPVSLQTPLGNGPWIVMIANFYSTAR